MGKNASVVGNKKRREIKIIVVAVALLVIISGAAIIFNTNKKQTTEKRYDVQTIETIAPLVFKGSAVAEDDRLIYFDPKLGEIDKIMVKDQQKVNPQDIVLTYKNETADAQLKQQERTINKATIALENANENVKTAEQKVADFEKEYNESVKEYNEINNSTPEGAAKESELYAKADQLKTAIANQKDGVTTAKQAVRLAESDLTDAQAGLEDLQAEQSNEVKAPIGGTVYVDETAKTDGTKPVIKIIREQTVIEGVVSEYDYEHLNEGTTVSVQTLNSDKEVNGEISEIDKLPLSKGPTDTSTFINYGFKVKVEAPIQNGYNVQISLPVKEVRVPLKAIVSEKQAEYVFVYNKGKVTKQAIRCQREKAYAIVQEGLKVGDQFISQPDKTLRDGQSVVIK